MTKTKTLFACLKETVNGYGIIRCEEKRVNADGEVYGQMRVWYDVCADNGEGDILESFKRVADARRYAKSL